MSVLNFVPVCLSATVTLIYVLSLQIFINYFSLFALILLLLWLRYHPLM